MKGFGWRKEHADPRDFTHGAVPEISERVDSTREKPDVKLRNLIEIKAYIRAGFPVVFGFTVFPSIDQVKKDGWVPLPTPTERPAGGHAVFACAYSNLKKSGLLG